MVNPKQPNDERILSAAVKEALSSLGYDLIDTDKVADLVTTNLFIMGTDMAEFARSMADADPRCLNPDFTGDDRP